MQPFSTELFNAPRRDFLQRSAALVTLGAGASLPFGVTGCASSPAVSTTSTAPREAMGFRLNGVNLATATYKGREALSVELTAEAQKALLSGSGVGNGPTYAISPIEFANGVIEVDLAARINGRGAPDVRGFVGIAFHIDGSNETFEAVYLRMTNGSKNVPPPPPPRNVYAVQYISFPDRYWRKLRQEFPNKYEKAAPVAIESWHTLRLDIQGDTLRATVDGQNVLTVDDLRFPGRRGHVGLWVDDGTTGYFSNLRIRAA